MRFIICLSLLFVPVYFDCAAQADQKPIESIEDFWQKYALTKGQKAALVRPRPGNPKISLIIPCYYKHASKLHALLRMYEAQTRLPDEVIISLSEVHLVEQDVLDELTSERWAFPVTIMMTKEKKYAGENRNCACEQATGDVFVCQDADDIPHPQRIEIIQYLFATYKIDHLMHRYMMVEPKTTEVPFVLHSDFKQLKLGQTKNFQEVWSYSGITNGNSAITKQVFDAIQWPDTPRGQDTEFNRAAYKAFENCLVIDVVLYGYRQYLSSAVKRAEEVEVPSEVVYTNERNQQDAIEAIESTS